MMNNEQEGKKNQEKFNINKLSNRLVWSSFGDLHDLILKVLWISEC